MRTRPSDPEREVVRGEPLEVARDRAGEPEEADADDRDAEREDVRALGGAGDQVAGRRHQADAAQHRRRAERDGDERRARAARRRARSRRRSVAVMRRRSRRPRGRGRAASSITRSARRTSSGRCAMSRPCGRRGGARPPRRRASALIRVEVGGRLVEHHERRIAQERARQRDPPPLAGGQRPAAVADHASRSRPAGDARTRRRRPATAASTHVARRTRRRSPSRMLSATVPRRSAGRCGTHAT